MQKLLLPFSLFSALALTAGAEVLLNETFPYAPGSLNSQGAWVTSGSAGSCPINVIEGSMSYPGYQDAAAGNHVRVGMDSGKNSLQNIFAPKGTDAKNEGVFYSAIIKVEEFPSSLGKPGAVICLTGVNDYDGSYGDSQTGSEGAGLFIKPGTGENTAVVGICRQSSPNGVTADDVTWSSKEIALGQEALVVVYYEKVDGAANDPIDLWVNPTADKADSPDVSGKGNESLVDIRGIALCQRSAITSKIPAVAVDHLRVATDWNEIFSGQGSAVVIPNITISENPVNFGQSYCNVTVTKTVNIRATDLIGDITLTLGESGQVALSAETITKEQAMSEEGFDLEISLTPVESRFYSDRVSLSTEGASDKVINIQWASVPSLVATSLASLCNEDEHDMTSVYVYKGEAVVTFVESYYDLSYDRVVNSIFCQDATGGVELRSATGCGYQEIDIEGIKVGDALTDIVGYLIFGDNGLTMIPRTPADWRVVSHDNVVTPIDLTLRQIAEADNGYVYGNQLVRVLNVTFPDEYAAAGDYHGLWNSQKYEIYDGTLDDYQGMAWMWCNKGADYFKQPTDGYFTHVWNLTGICNNYYPIHISPRSFLDFDDQGEKGSSIDAAEAVAPNGNDVKAVYDLMGRQVGNDATGICIERRADGSVVKIFRR